MNPVRDSMCGHKTGIKLEVTKVVSLVKMAENVTPIEKNRKLNCEF